jgi:hypothetical protein
MKGYKYMRHGSILNIAVVAIVLLSQPNVGVLSSTAASRAGSNGAQAVIPATPCPDINVNISFVNITPTTPAKQHVVNMTWNATAPTCFTLKEFKVDGAVTFANGVSRTFQGIFLPNHFGAHIPVSGVPDTKPLKAIVKITAIATAPISGSGSFPPPSLTITSCNPITVTVPQAAMTGLAPATDRPGHDFYPKVKVEWQTPNLGACQRLSQFTVEGELKKGSKSVKFSRVVSGELRSTEFILTSLAVGSNFTPDAIWARVTAAGEAKVTGSALKEFHFN